MKKSFNRLISIGIFGLTLTALQTSLASTEIQRVTNDSGFSISICFDRQCYLIPNNGNRELQITTPNVILFAECKPSEIKNSKCPAQDYVNNIVGMNNEDSRETYDFYIQEPHQIKQYSILDDEHAYPNVGKSGEGRYSFDIHFHQGISSCLWNVSGKIASKCS